MTEKTNPYHEIAAFLGEFTNDPLGFVYACFPWGQDELKGQEGPDDWQKDYLSGLGERLRANVGKEDQIVRNAVASGHGIGKSALVSWLILWAISTRPGTKIVVTANTERQLLTKTVPEVAKWHRLFIGKALFTMTATALYSADGGHERTWRCDFMPWSVNNADAFAGLHNQDGRILLVFDEASGIDRKIWEVAEGALTDKHTQIIWAVFGNPTRPEGKFFECFHTHRALWNTRKVDSRTVKITNRQQLQSWVDTYGEDSDFVRVRVRGEFPRHGENQFISPDLVSKARQIIIPKPQYANISPVIGVDVARMGNDASIILVRQGDKVHPAQKFNQIDTMELAGKVFDTYSKYGRMGAICIDAVGVGAGLFDFLRSRGLPVIEVQSASKATDFKTYANKRAELYGKVKEWLEQGGALPEDPDLEEQLSCFSYSFNNRLQILLESKDDIKKRIGKSPDVSDALAYTFAYEEAVRLAHMTRAKPIKRVQW